MSVYHYRLIHTQLTIEGKRKQKKKSKVIKAYDSIFFSILSPCLFEIFGWFICALLRAGSRLMASEQVGKEAGGLLTLLGLGPLVLCQSQLALNLI